MQPRNRGAPEPGAAQAPATTRRPFLHPRHLLAALAPAALFWSSLAAAGQLWQVESPLQLRARLRDVRAGDTVLIAPGTYSGDLLLSGLHGTAEAPITIAGADPGSPPIFQSGSSGFVIENCRYLRLRSVRLVGYAAGALTIAARAATPGATHHLVIEDLTIADNDPRGNRHGILLRDVADFVIRRCRFESWGGAAICVAGGQRGLIQRCRFLGQQDSTQAYGVLVCGGASNMLVEANLFNWAGTRSISIGGPAPADPERATTGPFAAMDIDVAGNRFLGGTLAVAWQHAERGRVHHNTIVLPHHMVARIVNDPAVTGLAPTRNCSFERNVVVIDQRVSTIMAVDEETASATFVMRDNVWHRAQGTRPIRLPIPEQNGLVTLDPRIAMDGPAALQVTADDPRLADRGADAYRIRPAPFTLP